MLRDDANYKGKQKRKEIQNKQSIRKKKNNKDPESVISVQRLPHKTESHKIIYEIS